MLSTCPQETQTAKPFLKWAGGKTQLIREIDPLLEQIFSQYQSVTYIEPFVGGGAILFYVLNKFPQVKRVIINDINPDLINAYKVIKNSPEELIEKLQKLEKKYNMKNLESQKNFYLEQRDQFNLNKSTTPLEKTTLLLFLNKTCFNGLYRVNSRGLFNVPFGQYIKPKICDESNLIAVHKCLKKAEIFMGDFEETLLLADRPTLFYLDPPYKPIKTTSAFTAYTKENFTDMDQERLKNFCDKIHKKDCHFILSNSDVKNLDNSNNFFDQLYQGYHIRRVWAKRNINAKGNRRGEISELLISNFEVIRE
jgi:DNA adenine methylase